MMVLRCNLKKTDLLLLQKEYWVNVYPGYNYGMNHKSRRIAESLDGGCSIYRIHVKMKEVNSGVGKFEPRYNFTS